MNQVRKLDKLLESQNLPKLPRRGKYQLDSSRLNQQEPSVWDSPDLILLSHKVDSLLLASRKPERKRSLGRVVSNLVLALRSEVDWTLVVAILMTAAILVCRFVER